MCVGEDTLTTDSEAVRRLSVVEEVNTLMHKQLSAQSARGTDWTLESVHQSYFCWVFNSFWLVVYRLTPGSEAVRDIPEAVYSTTRGRSPRGVE